MVGTTISHYKVLEKIGEGGMGEVYLAQDTTLDRKVALKFLPEEMQQDSTAKKRFLREAKSAAALDHPFICHIHEVGEVEGKSFISMEYIQGTTLKEKLVEGPLPVKEALEKATEVAEALEEAHKQGIVHRDVKPANIMLTPQGHVKVMDFGLAKQVTPVEGQEQEITTALTQQGSTLGTVPYMSPEQVRGQEVDTRSDIFSFGVVLYEMVSGLNPFKKGSAMDTATAILGKTPSPLTRYTENIPVLLQHTVKKMLAKEPDRRYQLIHDVRTNLGELIEESGDLIREVAAGPSGASSAAGWWRWAIPWSIAVVAVVVAGLALWNLTSPTTSPSTPPVVRSLVALSDDLRIADLSKGVVALSPDGTHLAYAATRDGTTMLFLRAMDQLEAQPIPATEAGSSPFFSPDGQWLGFFADAKLKKVLVSGGAPVILSDVPSPNASASWGAVETIVLTPFVNSSLFHVSAEGGTLQPLTTLDSANGESDNVSPQVLPDAKAVLFTVVSAGNVQIVVQSLETEERRVVLEGVTGARYVPTGHLVYPEAGTLMAVTFDLEQLKVTGSPIPILQGIMESGTPSRFAHFAFSDTGTLVYVSTDTNPRQGRTLVWVDRKGAEEPLAAPPRIYFHPRLSPDGQKAAVTIEVNDQENISVYDIRRDAWTQLTFEDGHFPLWTPDGKRIVFASTRFGPQNLFWKPADGTGAAERLSESALSHTAHSWSPDGKSLAFTELHPTSSGDIWVLPLEGERTPWPFLQTPSSETGVVFSPDGHWVAYRSNESGRQEIYVQPFPSTGAKWLISTEGGEEAAWAGSGSEIFYRNGDQMMAVDITTEPTFTHGKPKLLFEGRYVRAGFRSAYDVTPDGQRFLMIKESEQESTVTQLNIVLNWFEELKRLVPTP